MKYIYLIILVFIFALVNVETKLYMLLTLFILIILVYSYDNEEKYKKSIKNKVYYENIPLLISIYLNDDLSKLLKSKYIKDIISKFKKLEYWDISIGNKKSELSYLQSIRFTYSNYQWYIIQNYWDRKQIINSQIINKNSSEIIFWVPIFYEKLDWLSLYIKIDDIWRLNIYIGVWWETILQSYNFKDYKDTNEDELFIVKLCDNYELLNLSETSDFLFKNKWDAKRYNKYKMSLINHYINESKKYDLNIIDVSDEFKHLMSINSSTYSE